MENLVTMSQPRHPVLDVRGRRVLVTGHTGFKGAWLTQWLLRAGAQVSGIALPPETPDALYGRLALNGRVPETLVDIRDAAGLARAVEAARPDLVFHLAAQALVRRSYQRPLETWETNVTGTLNLLEAVRALARPIVVVVVTTDKVYRNREWEFAYREDDPLGGHDPYSASKAACELAVDSWRASFGSPAGVTVVTARAGNVIGAGDVCEDRIVPDCFRAWRKGEAVRLRNPGSTRPWQHVLEPLSGYVALAAHAEQHRGAITACNFGPDHEGDGTVAALVEALAALGENRRWSVAPAPAQHEARALALCIDRARHVLGWSPRLTFREMLEWTNAGYTAPAAGLRELVDRQIADFEARGAVFQPA
jgi:CDP-glucose 4,6-dehydratase